MGKPEKAGKTSTQVSGAMLGQFQKTLTASQKFIDSFEKKTNNEIGKINQEMNELKKIVRKEANHSRAYNLVIRGIEPEYDTDDKLRAFVVSIINANILKNHPLKIDPRMIDEVHRKVGDTGNPPAVIVSFIKLSDKKLVVSNLRHLDELNKDRARNNVKKLSVSQLYEPATDAKHRYLKRLQGAINRVKKIPYKDMKVKINKEGEPFIELEGEKFISTEIPDRFLVEGMTRFGVPRKKNPKSNVPPTGSTGHQAASTSNQPPQVARKGNGAAASAAAANAEEAMQVEEVFVDAR